MKRKDLVGIENHLKALNMWKFKAECRDRKKNLRGSVEKNSARDETDKS